MCRHIGSSLFYAGMGHRSVFSGLITKQKKLWKCQVQGLDWKIFERFSESLELKSKYGLLEAKTLRNKEWL